MTFQRRWAITKIVVLMIPIDLPFPNVIYEINSSVKSSMQAIIIQNDYSCFQNAEIIREKILTTKKTIFVKQGSLFRRMVKRKLLAFFFCYFIFVFCFFVLPFVCWKTYIPIATFNQRCLSIEVTKIIIQTLLHHDFIGDLGNVCLQ